MIPSIVLANMSTSLYAIDPSDFLAESRSPGIRNVSRGGTTHDVAGSRDRGRGRQGGYRQPFKGVDGGVFEIALKHRGDAYRTIYAVQIGDDMWVVDAFQKKSKSGIKTPQMDVDRIRERIKRLKEALR
jgi:hypothetical protein